MTLFFWLLLLLFPCVLAAPSAAAQHSHQDCRDAVGCSELDKWHPLRGRRVFWHGFDFVQDFVINFLQIPQKCMLKYKRKDASSACTITDILVFSGPCSHCTNFQGLMIYIDGEAGKFPLNLNKRENLIYLGVSNIALPPNTVHIKMMYGVSALRYNTLLADEIFNRTVNVNSKTKFAAYAVSKCLKHRETVYDALVDLAVAHNLGAVTAYGKCHGSSKNLHTTAAVAGIDSHRSSYMMNHVLFQPYRFVLCMENVDASYYMTEKIFNVFHAGAIPIYWGASVVVTELFHPDTVIIVDPENPAVAMSRILEIERDPVLYERILKTPMLRFGHRSMKKFFALNISLRDDLQSPSRKYSSLSNYIWAAILNRLSPQPMA